MNKIDPQTAQQVWQRVQSPAEPAQDARELAELIRQLQEDASCCLQLARQLPEGYRARLKQLARREQSHASCLNGMYHLLTGKKLSLPPSRWEAEPAEIALRRYYGRKLQCLHHYEKRISDPQFGPSFSRLAQQTREQCQELLMLLGSLP